MRRSARPCRPGRCRRPAGQSRRSRRGRRRGCRRCRSPLGRARRCCSPGRPPGRRCTRRGPLQHTTDVGAARMAVDQFVAEHTQGGRDARGPKAPHPITMPCCMPHRSPHTDPPTIARRAAFVLAGHAGAVDQGGGATAIRARAVGLALRAAVGALRGGGQDASRKDVRQALDSGLRCAVPCVPCCAVPRCCVRRLPPSRSLAQPLCHVCLPLLSSPPCKWRWRGRLCSLGRTQCTR